MEWALIPAAANSFIYLVSADMLYKSIYYKISSSAKPIPLTIFPAFKQAEIFAIFSKHLTSSGHSVIESACLKPYRPVYSAIVELQVREATVMSVNKIELGSMSDDELWSLHEEICEILSSRILEQKRELDKRLAVLHATSQTTLEAPPQKSGKSRRKYPKVLPQFFNPETAETWAGRGKQPRWLILAQESGRDIEEFRIKR